MSNDELTLDDLMAKTEWPVDSRTDWAMLINEQPTFAPVFRIEERDKHNGPQCTLPDGEQIKLSRIVVRVGYEFGVHSITKTAWWEAGLEIAAKEIEMPAEDVKKVIVGLGLTAPFRNLKGQIYDAKIRPLTVQPGPNRNVRAMWFYDYQKPRRGRIAGRVTRLTGHREPGSCSEYDGDYEPPVLTDSRIQRLYKVDFWDDEFSGAYDRGMLIYPEDVL